MKKLNKADCIKFIHVLHFINSMADQSRERDGLNDGHFCSFSESYDIHVLLILLVENFQLFLYVFVCVFVLWDGTELNSCIR